MGYPRRRPKRMAEKLKQIRETLGLTQSELVAALGIDTPYNNVSKWELDKNEPPIDVLLAYCRHVGIPLEEIVDDQLEITINKFLRSK